MANIYKPIKEFKTRTEVKAYMSRKSVTWKKDEELSEWFEKDCFFSPENELLCIPRGKSDNIRGGADLLQNYQAVKEDLNSPSRPIESVLLKGFHAYIGEPDKISALAKEFLESKGFRLESGWGAAIANLDRWIDQMFEDGDAALLFQDNDTLCGLCAVAGEALREKLGTDSKCILVMELSNSTPLSASGSCALSPFWARQSFWSTFIASIGFPRFLDTRAELRGRVMDGR